MDVLLSYLRSLDEAGLAALVRRRPELATEPEPRDLPDVAVRLSSAYASYCAVAAVDRAGLDVLQAAAALGDTATEDALLALLAPVGSTDETAELLARTLTSLREAALLIPDAAGVLRLTLRESPWKAPLGLGRSLGTLLPLLRSDEVKRIAALVGAPVPARKADAVAAVVARLGDPDAVRALVAQAPPATRDVLEVVAADGPELVQEFGWLSRPREPEAWAVERGLLFAVAWNVFEMPAEIALALRGPGYRAPFTAPPPPPATAAVPDDTVLDAARAAAAGALTAVDQVLSFCARGGVRTVKAGGIGTREVRRAAKALRLSDGDAAFWFWLCWRAGLLADDGGAAVLTVEADGWRSAPPNEQLVVLATTWWGEDPDVPSQSDARRVLSGAADVLGGRAVHDVEALTDVLDWRAPLLSGAAGESRTRTRTTWRGAELLGAVAAGAVGPLGRALVSGCPDELGTAARAVAPRPVEVATFQSDLTATVAGVPAPELARLLDETAVSESRETASVWRFTPASVRSALDAGSSADTLLADLAAVSPSPLPQTLTYLVRDVARRHGAVRVTPVASCLRSDDPALLAEIVASRALARLSLRTLAPTVLASAATVEETLDALRAAGYAPVAESTDGTVEVTRGTARAAGGARASRRRPVAAVDPTSLAARLKSGRPAPRLSESSPSLAQIAALTPQLHPDERRTLAHAVDRGLPVRIDYVSATGRATTRVVETATVDGPFLSAWCTLRDSDRVFTLSRIRAVSACVTRAGRPGA